MAEVGWDDVTYLRKKAPKSTALKSQRAINAAQRSGAEIKTDKKFSAAQNKQSTAAKDTAKLDRETEELHHDRVSMGVAKHIQKRRSELKMTQKDLSTKINEKPQVVNDYEAGRAIPNPQIMGKLERALGIKLRGKDIGLPLHQPKK
ncbi:endothelial differentiation-related factor 1 homolog [Tubulanus polymorphus]|uniref:endothelial differentiation-related factor 1 homolog n=1 Tax=Tubulanus polymorphus TaxID=672921 RepID=UPI003DA44AE4